MEKKTTPTTNPPLCLCDDSLANKKPLLFIRGVVVQIMYSKIDEFALVLCGADGTSHHPFFSFFFHPHISFKRCTPPPPHCDTLTHSTSRAPLVLVQRRTTRCTRRARRTRRATGRRRTRRSTCTSPCGCPWRAQRWPPRTPSRRWPPWWSWYKLNPVDRSLKEPGIKPLSQTAKQEYRVRSSLLTLS